MQTLISQPGRPQVSATLPDPAREKCAFACWQPSRRLLRAIRRYQRWHGHLGPIGFIVSKLAVLSHRFWSVITGADIPINTRIGIGLLLPHPNGIVIYPDVVIGPNCLLFQQVTLGVGGSLPGCPTLGGHVDVGAGAKILGGVTIGDHARIGANAVVLCDVPAGATAVGVPARIVPQSQPGDASP